MDLRKMLKEQKLAEFFERLTQSSDGTLNALLAALDSNPNATLLVNNMDEVPPDHVIKGNSAIYVVPESGGPSSSVNFVSMGALQALAREYKQLEAKTNELLDWMVQKKMDR